MSLRILDAELLERRDREADHTARLVNLAGSIPATYGEHALRIQPFEKEPPRLNGIEAILRQRERASSCGRPRINEAHLDDIEESIGASKPASRLINLKCDPGHAPDGCVIGIVVCQEVNEDRVDL